MHIDFTDLVLCDYDHQEALMVIVPFLCVALIMQTAFWVDVSHPRRNPEAIALCLIITLFAAPFFDSVFHRAANSALRPREGAPPPPPRGLGVPS
jgi:hypothetical protein